MNLLKPTGLKGISLMACGEVSRGAQDQTHKRNPGGQVGQG